MLARGINTAMYNKTRVTGHLVTYFRSMSHFDTPRKWNAPLKWVNEVNSTVPVSNVVLVEQWNQC